MALITQTISKVSEMVGLCSFKNVPGGLSVVNYTN